MGLPALVAAPAAATPSDALRRRILHTGTDPELAGYRADIVAKGGHLTVDGFPRQPDTPSGLGRRWVIAGSGMAVTLASAIAASLVLGPQLGQPPLAWPSMEHPVRTPEETSGQVRGQAMQGGQADVPDLAAVPTPTPPDSGHASDDNDPESPQVTGTQTPEPEDVPPGSPTLSPSPSPSSSNPPPVQQPPPVAAPEPPAVPPAVARLTVGADEVAIGLGRTSRIPLAAENGPVPFTAQAADGDVVLAQQSGVVTPGEPFILEVKLPAALIRLPGSTTVSIVSGSDGTEHQVEVSWGLSLL
ncbi:hypothetical protein [Actinocorallia sp. A-T 12471]|uniref:hypothetical protein n=1 Tax=Actinocorallia sp. A-T 12471 TaxID=3089813 RepID=UPI0029CADDF0|nr:hypothetical protein [Actinocorallia sp. A-T 12471]MDX6742018.1 hypothetical protein [Actinocorallia sp. A-T 12471]